jgi:intein/homing endonuclease
MVVKNNYNRRKKIKCPKPSEALAEFIGIFLGDGSFGTKYQLTVSYNHICEEEYAGHIQEMISTLFGVDSKVRIRKQYGSAEIVVNSSNLVDYLRKLIGVKEGAPKKVFKLPRWLWKNRRYKIGLLRGLFDSEGCVYKHEYYSNVKSYSYTKIAVTNYCDKILSVFQKFLSGINIASTKYRNRVHIYSQTDTRKFFELVGSNNSKNEIRFQKFNYQSERYPSWLKGRAC